MLLLKKPLIIICVETVVPFNISVWTLLHLFQYFWWIKITTFIKTEIFCDIINVLTVTFDQINVALLNKIVNLFIWTVV